MTGHQSVAIWLLHVLAHCNLARFSGWLIFLCRLGCASMEANGIFFPLVQSFILILFKATGINTSEQSAFQLSALWQCSQVWIWLLRGDDIWYLRFAEDLHYTDHVSDDQLATVPQIRCTSLSQFDALVTSTGYEIVLKLWLKPCKSTRHDRTFVDHISMVVVWHHLVMTIQHFWIVNLELTSVLDIKV